MTAGIFIPQTIKLTEIRISAGVLREQVTVNIPEGPFQTGKPSRYSVRTIVGDCVRGGSDSHWLSLYDCRRAACTTGLANFRGLVLAAMRESMLC